MVNITNRQFRNESTKRENFCFSSAAHICSHVSLSVLQQSGSLRRPSQIASSAMSFVPRSVLITGRVPQSPAPHLSLFNYLAGTELAYADSSLSTKPSVARKRTMMISQVCISVACRHCLAQMSAPIGGELILSGSDWSVWRCHQCADCMVSL